MTEYPLYDVPYLVRDPNEYRMSEKRHQIEVRNQAVVDDYFVARANGASAREAREEVAQKYGKATNGCITSLFGSTEKRKKEENIIFWKNFSHRKEHQSRFSYYLCSRF